ncbi:hypothetical protein GIB67_004942 [Kingdonia uniflora]|uniref:C2 domain-containing protein n=1 Tax=Kingdonia uniflora TaxID=39325 RepID=A0A7J7P7Y3_9MAGN|nr:hypothetical protein GIB67_004942 [Kingdonia uniflora]
MDTMMAGYVTNQDGHKALNLFSTIQKSVMILDAWKNGEEDGSLGFYHRMMCLGVSLDEYSFATLIKACSCLTALEQGRKIHANAIKLECTSDQFVGTSLVDMYAKCLAQHGNGEEALNFFKQMRCQDIKPDSITFIGVLSACSRLGLVSEAYGYFNSMCTTIYRTRTILRVMDPVWNQNFEFGEIEGGEYLKIRHFSQDTFSDDNIGSARVNLEGLLEGSVRVIWVPLEKVNTGELRLQYRQ